MLGLVLILSLGIFAAGMFGGWIPMAREWPPSKLNVLVAFGGGALLGAACFLMLPEAGHHLEGLEGGSIEPAFALGGGLVLGFLVMFLLENVALPHLGHDDEHDHDEQGGQIHVHGVGFVAFVALSVHTLIDGIALGSAVAGEETIAFGSLVFFAIIFHKVPAAFSLTSALKLDEYDNKKMWIYLTIFNILVPIGAVISFVALQNLPDLWIGLLLAFSAGTFLHVATSDLLPVIHRQQHGRGLLSLAVVAGLAVMAAFGFVGVA